ncbi:TonB-dependent receptor [Aurantiacibacter suaedae]|uniref:TonB-dependent receptor n=1 Tax=Aurantiacibacter suaedae TaxID=2545755 RepID=UPI001F500780|nr:TonB-dependent receptor [Aurantiacibacter suaedae]
MSNSFCIRNRLAAGVALSVLAMPVGAFAQATEDAPGGSRSRAAPSNEIVVTATRQEEVLSRVPVSVAAFGEEQLDEQGVRNIDDIALIAPGLQVNRTDFRNAAAAQISIRGISSTAGASTTGIYIDDTPIQSRSLGYTSYSVFPQVFDLERVEVLRGPQGTLFGAGSQGGTVRFITPTPSLYDYSAYGRAEVSTTENGAESWEAGVAVGGPIVEDLLSFRISAWHRRDGGYVDRVNYDRPGGGGPYVSAFYLQFPNFQATFPGLTPSDTLSEPTTGTVVEEDSNYQEVDVLRGALRFAPSENLDITASVFWQDIYNNDSGSYWLNLSNPDENEYRQGNNQAQPSHDEFILPSLKIEYDAGPVTIVSNTSYFDRKQSAVNDYTAFERAIYYGSYLSDLDDTTTSYVYNEQQNFTQELRAEASDLGGLDLVVGLFYTKNDQLARQFNDISTVDASFPDGGCPAGLTPPICYGAPVTGGPNAPLDGAVFGNVLDAATLDEEQLAGFVQADYEIAEGLTLTAGLRVADTRVEIGFDNYGPIVGPVPVNASAVQEETPVTPKFGLSWQVNPDHLFYVSAAKGFRTGGGNPEIGQGCGFSLNANGLGTYDSDSLWSYEAGAKNNLFGGRLRVSTSAYYIDWQDIQQNILLQCGFQLVVNGGSAISTGFDSEIALEVTDFLTLSSAIGYNHTEFQEDVRNPTLPGTNLISEGNQVAAPSWQISSSAAFRYPIGANDAYFRADWQYVSDYPDDLTYLDPQNAASFNRSLGVVGDYHIVNLRAGIALENFDVSVFAKNLTNSNPELGRFESVDAFSGAGPNLVSGFTLRPRTFGLTVTARY